MKAKKKKKLEPAAKLQASVTKEVNYSTKILPPSIISNLQ